MHVIDALSIEGTSNFGVLCYGVFSLSELDAAHRMLMSFEDRTETKIQRLIADQWPNGVLLLEVTLTSEAQVPYAVVTVLSKMLDAGSCLSAVCMFDGVFGGYEDIFSDSVADQTYAFCFTKNQHVLNMDSETLLSKEWSSIIALCRKRLG